MKGFSGEPFRSSLYCSVWELHCSQHLHVTTHYCVCAFDSRHDNDAEVEPVPGVPQEGEGSHTEASGQDLNDRFKRVDTCEGVPEGEGIRGKIMFVHTGGKGVLQ